MLRLGGSAGGCHRHFTRHDTAGGRRRRLNFLDLPVIPDEEALAAFSGLPLIRRVDGAAAMDRLGEARYGHGRVRLRDIEAAAAGVGVIVKGGTKRAGVPLPGTAGSADPVPTVRSMYEVPLLALLWTALEATELLEITVDGWSPADSGASWRAGLGSGWRNWCFLSTSSWTQRCSDGIRRSRGNGWSPD